VGQVGLGAAGLGIARLLRAQGVKRLVGADLREEAMQRLRELGGEPLSLQQVMAQSDIIIATTGVRGLIKPDGSAKDRLFLRSQILTPRSNRSSRSSGARCLPLTAKASITYRGFPACSKERWRLAQRALRMACSWLPPMRWHALLATTTYCPIRWTWITIG
jgi:hypothetical protein